jgi:hypothetical protein
MNLEVLGLTLHEGVLMTLGAAPGKALWASLGRREVVLCQMFASGYPIRLIRHFSSSSWPQLATSGANPGAFLLNWELEFAPLVLKTVGKLPIFCLVGLYSNCGGGREALLSNLPPGALCYDLPSVESLAEPLRLLTIGQAPRLALSLSYEALGQTGNLLEVCL